MLLGIVVDDSGLVPDADVQRIKEFGKAIKERYGSPIAETSGKGNILTLKLQSKAMVDRVILQEEISKGERVLSWHLDGVSTDGSKVRLCEGNNIGHKRIARFDPVEITSLQLVIDESKAKPCIRRFAIFQE